MLASFLDELFQRSPGVVLKRNEMARLVKVRDDCERSTHY